MSQHDMSVANGPGLAFRSDMNAALQALASQSSGAPEPSPIYPCQLWADTGTGRLKQRNSANTAWLDMGELDSALRASAWDLLSSIPNFVTAPGRVTSLSASTTLTAAQMGLLLFDATAGARTFTLPPANAELGVVDVIVRRADNSGNRLVVQASGTDKIKFHTHLNAAGYSFLVLMGTGDWWHLRSDGAGNWWPVGRHDSASLGRPVFETTTTFSPGGWGAHNGSIYIRADWPWLWDHAQQSGMLTTEALRTGLEGCWTSGDGATTFRSPEARGEFIRMLDESRGVDAARVAGSFQKGSLQTYDPNRATLSVTGLTHTGTDAGILEKHGLDPAASADYPQSTAVSVDNNTTTAINIAGGVVRPRSIAYPGRIKLI